MAATICGRVVGIDFDAVVGFGVGGATVLIKALKFLRIASQGAVGQSIQTLAHALHRAIQPDGNTALAEQVLVGGLRERAASQGNHHGLAALDLAHAPVRRLMFDLAELRFAARVENLGDGDPARLRSPGPGRRKTNPSDRPADSRPWFCPRAMKPTR